MARSLGARIKAAKSVLIADGNLEAVGEFFTPDYVAHVTTPPFACGRPPSSRAFLTAPCNGPTPSLLTWQSDRTRVILTFGPSEA